MSKNKRLSRATKIPPLRLHKASGQGYVLLNGQRIYLGKYGLSETRQKYLMTVKEWETNGRMLSVDPKEITLVELLGRFWVHAEQYYRKPDGTPTGETDNHRSAIKSIRQCYGHLKAAEFGPRALKTVRQMMIEQGNCRNTINKNVRRIKNIFKWAAEEELVHPGVYEKLACVGNLKLGRSAARDTPKVPPVPDPYIEAIRPFVSRRVWAMIQFQIRTGARPGDATLLRLIDIDTSGTVWQYRPHKHKTEHHGHERVIYVGPDAQGVLREFMDRPVTDYVFSPKEADAERRAAVHAERKTPLSCGNRPGTNSEEKAEARARRAVHDGLLPAGHPARLRQS